MFIGPRQGFKFVRLKAVTRSHPHQCLQATRPSLDYSFALTGARLLPSTTKNKHERFGHLPLWLKLVLASLEVCNVGHVDLW